MKRSYYKLALLYHPDRVAVEDKEEAKNKFNIIHNAYSILTDATKKREYDNGSNVLFTKATQSAQWERHLKPVTQADIDDAKNRYQGSDKEKNDLMCEFVRGNGSMTHMLNNVPFMRVEDEYRIIEIIKDVMEKNELPKIPIKKIRK